MVYLQSFFHTNTLNSNISLDNTPQSRQPNELFPKKSLRKHKITSIEVLMFSTMSVQVDTAGWLDRTKQDKGPSSLSIVQSRKHLMRAHVVALILDAEEVCCV